jgi:hypothetical protein
MAHFRDSNIPVEVSIFIDSLFLISHIFENSQYPYVAVAKSKAAQLTIHNLYNLTLSQFAQANVNFRPHEQALIFARNTVIQAIHYHFHSSPLFDTVPIPALVY